jgi:hypothetical protein
VNITPATPRRLTAIVFGCPMFLVAATLAFLCLSNVVLCIQEQQLRTELFNLRSTVSADVARPLDQASLASGVGDASFTRDAK